MPKKTAWSICQILSLLNGNYMLPSIPLSQVGLGSILTCCIGTSWVMGLGMWPSKILLITVAMKTMALVGFLFCFCFLNHFCDFIKEACFQPQVHIGSLWSTQLVYKGKATDWVKYSLLVSWLVGSIKIEMYFVQGSVLTVTKE